MLSMRQDWLQRAATLRRWISERFSGLSFKDLTSGYGPHVERYAPLLDRPVALFEDGVLRLHSKLVEARGEKLTFAQMSRQGLSFCPHCLVEDEDSGRGRPGHRSYGRLHWQVNAVRTCPLHEVRVVMADLPTPSMTYDTALMLSPYRHQRRCSWRICRNRLPRPFDSGVMHLG